MKSLVQEIELLQGGYTNETTDNDADRQAVYVITGTVNEHQEGENLTLQIRSRLLDARSGRELRAVETSSKVDQLSEDIGRSVLLLAGLALGQPKVDESSHKTPAGVNEIELLFQQAYVDATSIVRPDYTHSTLECRVNDYEQGAKAIPAELKAKRRSYSLTHPLRSYVINKAIDSLESVIYLQPDHRPACVVLAYCLAEQGHARCDMNRAEELLERVYRNQSDELADLALHLSYQIYFPKGSGTLIGSLADECGEHIEYAFFHMNRNYHDDKQSRPWETMLRMMPDVCQAKGEYQTSIDFLLKAADHYEQNCPELYNPAVDITAWAAGCIKSANQTSGPDRDRLLEAQTLLERWATSEHFNLKKNACWRLMFLCREKKDDAGFVRWAGLIVDGDEVIHKPKTPEGWQERNAKLHLLLVAAEHYINKGELDTALKLLSRVEPDFSYAQRLIDGYLGVKLGDIYERKKDFQKALDYYVTAAESIWALESNTDVMARITRLGGVPLREERDIDVVAHDISILRMKTEPYLSNRLKLASTNDQLYVAVNKVMRFDQQTYEFKELDGPTGKLSCLAAENGTLWVGSEGEGLWKHGISSGGWQHWSTSEKLPHDQVIYLKPYQDGVFAVLGDRQQQGIVYLDSRGVVERLQGAHAPAGYLRQILIHAKELIVVGQSQIFRMSLETRDWQKPERLSMSSLFSVGDTLWANGHQNLLYPADAEKSEKEKYQRASFSYDQTGASVSIRFVIEDDGQIWYGGDGIRAVYSGGLYKFDAATGVNTVYGCRDGFPLRTSRCYDAVKIGKKLWLSTSEGLLEITPRAAK